jgi:hypothetical protein
MTRHSLGGLLLQMVVRRVTMVEVPGAGAMGWRT